MNIVTANNPLETPGVGVPVPLVEVSIDEPGTDKIPLDFSDLLGSIGISAEDNSGRIQAEQPDLTEAGKELPPSAGPGNVLPHSLPSLETAQKVIDPSQPDHDGADTHVAVDVRPAAPTSVLPELGDSTVSTQVPTPPKPQTDLPAPATPEQPKVLPNLPRPVVPAQSLPRAISNTLATDETAVDLEPVRIAPERAVTEIIQKNADNPQLTRSLDLPQPVMAKFDHIVSQQSQPTSGTQMSSSTPLGQQIETLIDNLAHARESSRVARGDMTLRHPDFGAVAVGLERAESDLRAVLTSRDPGFASAAQSALAERAVAAAADTQSANSRGQDGTPGQQTASRDAGVAAQGDQRGQHQQTENKQQDAPTQAGDLRGQADLAETSTPPSDDQDDGVLA